MKKVNGASMKLSPALNRPNLPTNRTSGLPFRVGLVLACTLAGAAWLIHQGPVPVVRITTPLPEAAPFWYMLLAFPILGLLVADLLDLYKAERFSPSTIELARQIALTARARLPVK